MVLVVMSDITKEQMLDYMDTFESPNTEQRASDLEDLFCECNLVSYGEIQQLKKEEFEDFKKSLKNLKVGTGCGSCLKNCSASKLYKMI